MWPAVNILLRSRLFKLLTVILMLSATVSEGLQDLLIQYLQLKMGFDVKDQVGVESGISILSLV
jgi:hypothetical protein